MLLRPALQRHAEAGGVAAARSILPFEALPPSESTENWRGSGKGGVQRGEGLAGEGWHSTLLPARGGPGHSASSPTLLAYRLWR